MAWHGLKVFIAQRPARRSPNMVFTQGRGFVLGASSSLQIRLLRCRFPVCDTADTASLAT